MTLRQNKLTWNDALLLNCLSSVLLFYFMYFSFFRFNTSLHIITHIRVDYTTVSKLHAVLVFESCCTLVHGKPYEIRLDHKLCSGDCGVYVYEFCALGIRKYHCFLFSSRKLWLCTVWCYYYNFSALNLSSPALLAWLLCFETFFLLTLQTLLCLLLSCLIQNFLKWFYADAQVIWQCGRWLQDNTSQQY